MVKLTPSTPTGLSEPVDPIQALLQRKQEQAKQKAKRTLTEQDANLLLTHSIERTFPDGQVLITEGDENHKVYRIKSGKVSLSRGGLKMIELAKGWFIGDSVFLSDKPQPAKFTAVAIGSVVLHELNITFIKQLFGIDVGISVKFMHHLAAKYSSLFHRSVGNILFPGVIPKENFDRAPSDRGFKKQRAKTTSYKEYPLVSSSHCNTGVAIIKLKGKTIEILTKSLGFKFNNRIEFTKLHRVSTQDKNGVTFVHHPKKVTAVVFKNYHDREEFLNLVSSLTSLEIENSNRQPAAPLPLPPNELKESGEFATDFLQSIQTSKTLKKGEHVFQEGDLFQRVYILGAGTFDFYQGKTYKSSLASGAILGVGTLLHLRPFPLTLTVSSDTAQVFYIPAYKINELINSDISHANHMYKVIARKLEKGMLHKWDIHVELQRPNPNLDDLLGKPRADYHLYFSNSQGTNIAPDSPTTSSAPSSPSLVKRTSSPKPVETPTTMTATISTAC